MPTQSDEATKALDWRAHSYLGNRWAVIGETGITIAEDLTEAQARLIAAAPAMAHMLTAVAEACEENLADYRSGRFLFCEVAPFLEATAKRARAAHELLGKAPQ